MTNETYLAAAIEAMGQVITGYKYQIDMLEKENTELRKRIAELEGKRDA